MVLYIDPGGHPHLAGLHAAGMGCTGTACARSEDRVAEFAHRALFRRVRKNRDWSWHRDVEATDLAEAVRAYWAA